ncbi:peptidase S8/S53 domain-containing protein [Umbelopsis sp. PMI_123]|nr:peptidase S8/S53 domain-containing protein [Umbelopsis sp. PMI_123]
MCYLAAQFLTSQFKEFVAGAVLEDHILSSSFDTASLTTISLNEDFHAVSGVFHERFAQFLKKRGDIEYIEKNEIYKAVRVLPPAQSPGLQKRSVEKYQTPSWGLARIFHRENTDLNNYEVENGNGEGVTVYVLDSGIYTGHDDFEGRASSAANFITNEDDTDYAGHGTHVAGTIAGKQYGVAKKATIKSVKILDKNGDGTTAGLLKALAYVTSNATPGKSIINLSLSGPRSKIVEQAIEETAKRHNVPMFVSAGNTADDACKYLPAASSHVFTVGATDEKDIVAYYSAVGQCVRMYAPGSGIISAWMGGNNSTMKLDGTSMANPHVAGIAASLLSKGTYSDIEQLYSDLENRGTKDILKMSTVFKFNDLPFKNVLAFAG